MIAIEPHLGAYREMLENIRLNGLEKLIIPVNAGLSNKVGKIHIANIRTTETISMCHKSSKNIGVVDAITLDEVVDEFNINGNAVLKIDCEGCEYEVLLNTKYKTLKVFELMVIEYHKGYKKIKQFLERFGYRVVLKPIKSSGLLSKQISINKQGYLIAKRYYNIKDNDEQ